MKQKGGKSCGKVKVITDDKECNMLEPFKVGQTYEKHKVASVIGALEGLTPQTPIIGSG